MSRTTRAVGAAVAVFFVAAAAALGASISSPTEYELADEVPLGTDSAGRAWLLGGFSGLYPIGSSGSEYWTLTDRGPNDDSDRELADGTGVYCAAKPSGKVIFLPGFNPQLVKLGLSQDRIKLQERVPLHDGSHPASGLPNLAGDETAYVQSDAAAKTCTPIATDPFGVDTEGVVVDLRDGSFWIADEYRPSVIHVAPDGQILSRLVPEDLASPALPTATAYADSVEAAGGKFEVQPVFPGIVNGFRKNRGFEGVAISPDGTTLYTMLQSPMDYRTAWGSGLVSTANRNKARNSPYIRVFRVDITEPEAPVVTAGWIYMLDRGFSSAVPDKISELVWLAPDVLLVQERDDERPTVVTNLYRADFTAATNVLDPGNADALALAAKATVPTLEMTDPPMPGFITPAAKTALASEDVDALLTGAGFVNSKVEGIALVQARGKNPGLLAVVNDNDFDLDHTVLGTPSIPERVELFPRP